MNPVNPRQPSGRSTSVERNGTHIRILITVPTDSPPGTLDIHHLTENIALHLARIVVLIAPTTSDLDHHTRRLQTAAATAGWQLVPADGMHRRLLDALTTGAAPVHPCA